MLEQARPMQLAVAEREALGARIGTGRGRLEDMLMMLNSQSSASEVLHLSIVLTMCASDCSCHI